MYSHGVADGDASTTGVFERFRAAAAGTLAGDIEALPTRLCQAAQEVLGTDGAGISVLSRQFRVPLGGTDAEAVLVERLQFTAQQGPCWDAILADVPLAVGAAEMELRWPEFTAELRARTRFRSVASVPVRLARGVGGALDLHFVDPTAATRLDLDAASAVTAHMSDLLNRSAGSTARPDVHGMTGPAWARGRLARGRMAVWLAIGMIVQHFNNLPDDAMAMLRAAAYSAGKTVDEFSAAVVDRRVPLSDLGR